MKSIPITWIIYTRCNSIPHTKLRVVMIEDTWDCNIKAISDAIKSFYANRENPNRISICHFKPLFTKKHSDLEIIRFAHISVSRYLFVWSACQNVTPVPGRQICFNGQLTLIMIYGTALKEIGIWHWYPTVRILFVSTISIWQTVL